MPPQFQLDADRPQPLRVRHARANVGYRHVRAPPGQQFRGCKTAARGAGHRDALPVDAERHHRNFNVVRLNRAKMTATITKRVITFGSLQPINSK